MNSFPHPPLLGTLGTSPEFHTDTLRRDCERVNTGPLGSGSSPVHPLYSPVMLFLPLSHPPFLFLLLTHSHLVTVHPSIRPAVEKLLNT